MWHDLPAGAYRNVYPNHLIWKMTVCKHDKFEPNPIWEAWTPIKPTAATNSKPTSWAPSSAPCERRSNAWRPYCAMSASVRWRFMAFLIASATAAWHKLACGASKCTCPGQNIPMTQEQGTPPTLSRSWSSCVAIKLEMARMACCCRTLLGPHLMDQKLCQVGAWRIWDGFELGGLGCSHSGVPDTMRVVMNFNFPGWSANT